MHLQPVGGACLLVVFTPVVQIIDLFFLLLDSIQHPGLLQTRVQADDLHADGRLVHHVLQVSVPLAPPGGHSQTFLRLSNLTTLTPLAATTA